MGKTCGIENCTNNRRHPNYPVYSFLRDRQRRLNSFGSYLKKVISIDGNHGLCALHFNESDYINDFGKWKHLSAHAVPSIECE